jgi:hypothetical protein
MQSYRVFFEHHVTTDSPETAAMVVRNLLKDSLLGVFIVDVPDGKVVVDTELDYETVIRDDRKRIGPVVLRRQGPTGVLTSPVMAEHYGHDNVQNKTDLEEVDGNWLRLRGCGPEAFYEFVSKDGTASEPFAVITVQRRFDSRYVPPHQQFAPAK